MGALLSNTANTSANLAHIVDVVRGDVAHAIVTSNIIPEVKAVAQMGVKYYMVGTSVLFAATIVLLMSSIALLCAHLYDPQLSCKITVYYNIAVFVSSVAMGIGIIIAHGTVYGLSKVVREKSYEILRDNFGNAQVAS